MKKKIMALSLSVLLLAGCGRTNATLKDGEEVIVGIKGDKTISVKELYDKMKAQFGLEALVNMIDKLILEDKYQGDIEAAKADADSSINQLKESYGDDLLQAIQYYTNYNTIEDYQDYLYISYLQQKAIKDYAKNQISESDIKKYYKDEVKPDIKVSHILITPNVASDASSEDKTKAENEAKAKAEEVINKLKESNDIASTFAELAKEYSNDSATKEDGGNLGYINEDTLGDDYKNLVTSAYDLKDGNYTKEPVKSELGYHVVLRVETKEKSSIDDLKDSIKDKLADKYITDNNDTSIKAMQELRKEYDMDIKDEDLHNYYVNYIQNSLSKLKEEANSSNNTNK